MAKDKKDKKKKPKRPKGWAEKKLGESLSNVGKNLSQIESSERAKTQALKDQLYIRRRKGGET
tara:strand:- start:77 stop:265 length:189 start_codon:yes stop_codon:yes gene_type:complete